ncbi:MAG: hypothetical protein LC121_05360 [Anaerolineae bacterium]|nr:hypothetical protein [Anaerolineae bacterium]
MFTVEQHVRGKLACVKWKTLIEVPVPTHVLDKSNPTARLPMHALVPKHADHLQTYRQEGNTRAPVSQSRARHWRCGSDSAGAALALWSRRCVRI